MLDEVLKIRKFGMECVFLVERVVVYGNACCPALRDSKFLSWKLSAVAWPGEFRLTGALKEFDGRKENNQLSAFLNAKIFAMICMQIERKPF